MNTLKKYIFRKGLVSGFSCNPFTVVSNEITKFITLTSTSVLASWSPTSVVNTGATLDWTVSGGLTIAETTIDDPTFDFSTNSGTANVLVKNVDALTTFNINSLNIVTLDVSESTSLNTLYCYINSITTLNLGTITSLTSLLCNDNSLTTLDVSNNTGLTLLWCHNNSGMTTLNLGTITTLQTILCYNNSLTSLNVANITDLTALRCNDNSLSTLDVSNNISLNFLSCYHNSFSSTVTNQILADLVTNGVTNGNLNYRNNETGQGVTDRATLVTRGWTIVNYAT